MQCLWEGVLQTGYISSFLGSTEYWLLVYHTIEDSLDCESKIYCLQVKYVVASYMGNCRVVYLGHLCGVWYTEVFFQLCQKSHRTNLIFGIWNLLRYTFERAFLQRENLGILTHVLNYRNLKVIKSHVLSNAFKVFIWSLAATIYYHLSVAINLHEKKWVLLTATLHGILLNIYSAKLLKHRTLIKW